MDAAVQFTKCTTPSPQDVYLGPGGGGGKLFTPTYTCSGRCVEVESTSQTQVAFGIKLNGLAEMVHSWGCGHRKGNNPCSVCAVGPPWEVE